MTDTNSKETVARQTMILVAVFSYFALILPLTLAAPTSSTASFKTVKYANLLTYTKTLDDIIYKTVQEFTTVSLLGYKDKDRKPIYYKTSYKLNLTEPQRLIDQIKTIRAFLVPLENAMKELKKVNARHNYKDVRLIRLKAVDLALTIAYVANHLGYSVPKFDRAKAKKTSGSLFPMTSTPSLGNRVVNLLDCFQNELSFIRNYYYTSVHRVTIKVRK